MNKRLKVLLPLVGLLVIVGTFGTGTVIVCADDAGSAAASDATESLRGVGFMDAEGDGIAAVGGRGTVRLLQGKGVLWVKDFGGDADIRVRGYGEKTEYSDGWLQYAGFRGTAEVTGSRIVVVVAGVDIDLHARGAGRVMLWGHGTCTSVTPSGDEEAADWTGGFFRWHKFGAENEAVLPAV